MHPYDGRVVSNFIRQALAGEDITIYGDGGQTRDFTYVENVVRANLAACSAAEPAFGEPFNIGCGDRLSIVALWEKIAAAVGAPIAARHKPARAGDVRDSLASLERARAHLGWAPTIGLEEGLRRTIASFRALAGN